MPATEEMEEIIEVEDDHSEAAAVLKKSVMEALRAIEDPDLHRDIVELGFIQNLRACGGHVAFDIQLTTPACPVKDQMKKHAEEIVRALPGVVKAVVNMTAQTRQAPQVKNMIPGVKNAIAVASGKGGVGKSTTAVNLALALAETGARVGLMDADVYGPSIPIMLGIPEGEQPEGVEQNGQQRIFPLERYGVHLMSIGFLTGKGDPIVWRGPMVGKMIQTFLGSVAWGELDYLVIDLPPGTGDTQLTLVQSAPLAGAVIVTTPEAVASEDVLRAGKMFEKMSQQGTPVPILGIVENMSWYETPQGERIELFGSGGGERAAAEFGVPLLGQVPRVLEVTQGGDSGVPVMIGHPDSPAAHIYREIAGGVARRVSTLAMEARGFDEGRPLKTMEELKAENRV
jgi:ATP-binding protein involved in chromosome partitioning